MSRFWTDLNFTLRQRKIICFGFMWSFRFPWSDNGQNANYSSKIKNQMHKNQIYNQQIPFKLFKLHDPMTDKVKQITISNATRQKVQAAKSYIEQRYSKLLQQQRQKREYWDQLNKKMEELQLSDTEQNQIKKKIIHEEAQILRVERTKITIMDFTPLKIIGKGAFGQVRLCKWNKTSEPVAIKKLKKSEMIFKNKVIQSRQQRNVLAVSQKNPWIVNLKCSFQDPQNLYLVMEYLPGGDLMNLLMKKDIFTHEQAQFYTAEILMALDSVHKMKYIHRDLKPDNVLLDANGHIKLSDFGLCKHTEIRPKKLTDNLMKKEPENIPRSRNERDKFSNEQFQKDYHKRNTRKLAFSAVGTPDYVAPQVQGRVGYTETVDWWSMGVILYEMLVGYPPFASEQPRETWHKIQNWRKYLVIPKDADVSPQAADLIRKLISDPKDRLGVNGVEEIKAHPFFAGINWLKLRQRKSPYIPQVKGSWDTRNFDPYEEEQPWFPIDQGKKKPKKKNTEFIGYTYKPIQQPNSALLKALLDLQSNKIPQMQQNPLDYLGIEKPLDDYQISSLNNRFKKDKTERINKQFYATTALFGSKPSSKIEEKDKDRYKCYFNEPGEKKLMGQQLMTSTASGNNSINSQQQKLVTSVKKQSPATKYEKEKDSIIKDDKKLKVKMLTKKLG